MLATFALFAGLVAVPPCRPTLPAGRRGGAVRMAQEDGAEDLSSAFAARMREVSGSDKPSEIKARGSADALRAKTETARKAAASVKADAADFLAGGKKQAGAGRGYNNDDVAEVSTRGQLGALCSHAHDSPPHPAYWTHCSPSGSVVPVQRFDLRRRICSCAGCDLRR